MSVGARDTRPEDGLEDLRKQADDLRSTNRALFIVGLTAILAFAARVATVPGHPPAVPGITLFVGAAAGALGAVRWRRRELDPADEAHRYLHRVLLARKWLSWVATAAYVIALGAITLGALMH